VNTNNCNPASATSTDATISSQRNDGSNGLTADAPVGSTGAAGA
jgi:hypothetical protein